MSCSAVLVRKRSQNEVNVGLELQTPHVCSRPWPCRVLQLQQELCFVLGFVSHLSVTWG